MNTKLKLVFLLLVAIPQCLLAATVAGTGMSSEPHMPPGLVVVRDLGPYSQSFRSGLYCMSGCRFISGIDETTRKAGHFFLKEGAWVEMFLEGDARGGVVKKDSNYYSFQHLPGDFLTIRLFDHATESWKDSNVVNIPSKLASLVERDFGIDSKDPSSILWLRDPDLEKAIDGWKFFSLDCKERFEARIAHIRTHWAQKGYSFKDSSVEFPSPSNVVEASEVNFCLPFQYPGKVHFKGDGDLETTLHGISDLGSFLTKPYHLELCHVRLEKDGYNFPYYTLQRDGSASGPRPILWLIDGGPCTQWFATLEDPLIDWFLKHNFLVVIPRERIRQDFGYGHHEAGVGNLHKQSLEDAIAAVNDVIHKGIGNGEMVVGHGESYGGYALSAIATRWREFQDIAYFKPRGFFAQASLLAPDFSHEIYNTINYIPREMEFNFGGPHREQLESLFPLSRSDLEIPLVLIHGVTDDRCPIETTRAFYGKFREHALLEAYVEHKEGHYSIVEIAPDLGLRIIQNIISRWLPSIIRPQEISVGALAAAAIDVKKGKDLLSVVPVLSHNLHLFAF
jgi:hypothetical protein